MAGPIHRSLAVGHIARLSTRTRLHPRDRVSVTTDAAMSQSQGSSVRKDVIVVGNGPIGSAVARHVAEGGHSVLVVDGGKRLTSASDDMGRIVRPLDAEGRQRWTAWNVESIEAFHDMETRSGVEFFTRCGSLACLLRTPLERRLAGHPVLAGLAGSSPFGVSFPVATTLTAHMHKWCMQVYCARISKV